MVFQRDEVWRTICLFPLSSCFCPVHYINFCPYDCFYLLKIYITVSFSLSSLFCFLSIIYFTHFYIPFHFNILWVNCLIFYFFPHLLILCFAHFSATSTSSNFLYLILYLSPAPLSFFPSTTETCHSFVQ